MRIAIPYWRDRISPVFDTAQHLLLVEAEKGEEQRRENHDLERTDSTILARKVIALGTQVLICGAISAAPEMLLASEGVKVIGCTCGPVEDVLRAFCSGKLKDRDFLLPGCRRRRRGRSSRAPAPPGENAAGNSMNRMPNAGNGE